MATKSITLSNSYYGTGTWNWMPSDVEDGYSVYAGKGYVGEVVHYFRTRVSFNSGAFTGTPTKLILGFTLQAAGNPLATKAVLTPKLELAHNLVMNDYGSNPSDELLESSIATSYSYLDEAGTRITSTSVAKGSRVYYIFDTSGLSANTDYEIYVMRTTDNGAYDGYSNFSDADMSGNMLTTLQLTYAASYTVSYNANGGTGAPPSQTKNEGTNLTLSSTEPSYPGRTFQGWSTTKAKADAGTIDYAAGATYSNDASVTLYASWKLATYTITYDANGGTGAPSAQTKTHGVDLTLSSTKPTNSAKIYTSFTVTLNANGGTCSSSSLRAARTIGYTFSKWNTKSDGTGTNYESGASYTTDSAATMYAQWTTEITVSSVMLPIPTRTGYTFIGWGTSADATSGTPAGNYKPSKDITLYAVWSANGLAYIDNGTSFDAYTIWIDNGTSWDQYMAYIDNGSSWDPCG